MFNEGDAYILETLQCKDKKREHEGWVQKPADKSGPQEKNPGSEKQVGSHHGQGEDYPQEHSRTQKGPDKRGSGTPH